MADPTPELDPIQRAALEAIHAADCYPECELPLDYHARYGQYAEAVITAVTPLIEARAVAEGRRQAAEAIRAGLLAGTPIPVWARRGRTPTARGLQEWAARIAEGADDV